MTAAFAVNAVNPEAPFERAAQLTISFANETLRSRLARIISRQWRREAENFVALSDAEVDAGAPWMARARAEGRPPMLFTLDPASEARMRQFLARVREGLAAAEAPEPPSMGLEFALRERAMRFQEAVYHLEVEDLDLMAHAIVRLRASVARTRRLTAERHLPIHPPEHVPARGGCAWRIVETIGMLGEAGAALNVCTAFHRAEHAGYASMLREREAVFWVLTDKDGNAIALAMFLLPGGILREIKGAKNAPFDLKAPALGALMRKKKYRFAP